jgi:hypothetical protein
MSVALYMDQHVPDAITRGLRRRGVDVLRTQDDGYEQAADEDILDHAAAIGRVVFTRDDDLLVIAHARQAAGIRFAGVVFARQNGPSIGDCVRDLEVIAVASDPPDMAGRVEYLPL